MLLYKKAPSDKKIKSFTAKFIQRYVTLEFETINNSLIPTVVRANEHEVRLTNVVDPCNFQLQLINQVYVYKTQ